MFKSLRHIRYKAAAFVALSALGAGAAAAQETTAEAPQTVRVATDIGVSDMPAQTAAPDQLTGQALQPWQELAQAQLAAEDADLPPPDPCAYTMSPALRSMRGCVGNVTQAPDYSSLGTPRLDALIAENAARPFGAATAGSNDISQLVDPHPVYTGPGLPEVGDVIIVTARRLQDDSDINAAYLAGLEARFGGRNGTYEQFEDFLASNVGRTTTALGLGFFQNMIEDEVRDGIADIVIGDAESGNDFSMDPARDRTDAWFREMALRQRGIDPNTLTRR